ncbi:MAG: leucyl/phenylalanyl-tRNA--protein transferase, partial [Thermodesulfobacteriota bacterium]
MVEWLSNQLNFPDVKEAGLEGLLAVGGDLSPRRLLLAYRQGIFPWYSANEPILWWSPDPRAIVPLNDFRINRTMQKIL